MLLEIIMSLFDQNIFDPDIIASKLDFLSKNRQEVIACVEEVLEYFDIFVGFKMAYPEGKGHSYSDYIFQMSKYLFLKLKLLKKE